MDVQPLDTPRSAGDLRAFYAVALEKASERNTNNNPFRRRRSIVYRSVGFGKDVAEDLPALVRALSTYQSDSGKPLHDTTIPQLPPPPPPRPPHKPTELPNEAGAMFGEGGTIDSEFDDRQTRRRVLQLRIEEELSALKNILLDFACQRCRSQNLDCNRSRPSCANCEQKFQQCSYKHGMAVSPGGEDPQRAEIPVEPTLESLSWLDSLRDHPYYTTDKEQKMSRLDVWSLKARHPDPYSKPVVTCKNLAKEVAEGEEEEGLLWEAFFWTTPVDETPPTIEIDTAAGTASLKTPSTDTTPRVDTPAYPNSSAISATSSQYTISLVFSDELGSRASTNLTSWSASSTRTSFSHPGSLESQQDHRPRPFQCTFCLRQCEDMQDWKQHERSQHRQQEWICMPYGPTENIHGYNICVFCDASEPDTTHSSHHNSEPCSSLPVGDRTFIGEEEFREHLRKVHNQPAVTEHMQDNWWWYPRDDKHYWNCGFCDLLLTSWTERVKHIGDHFQEGMTMSSWDPLMPPSPLDKDTLTCASRFPPVGWNTGTLWSFQFGQCSQPSRTRETEGHQHCQFCGAHFETKADVIRHGEIWHQPRSVWCCPTMSDLRAAIHLQTGPLDRYLFPTTSAPEESDEDACPYCGHEFDDDEGWDVHVEHLETEHCFGECNPPHTFYRSDHLVIHLANVHHVMLSECFADIVNSCRKAERTLVKTGVKDSSLGKMTKRSRSDVSPC